MAFDIKFTTQALEHPMKVIELNATQKNLEELLELARRKTVILHQPGQNGFVLAPIDEFDLEIELLRNNPEFMAYLDGLSSQKATISIEEVEKELGLV